MNLFNKYLGRLIELRCHSLVLSLSKNMLFLQKFIAPMQRLFYLLDLKDYTLEGETALDTPLRVIQHSTKASHYLLQAILDSSKPAPKDKSQQRRMNKAELEDDLLKDRKYEYSTELLTFIDDCFEMSIHQLELILERFGDDYFSDTVRVDDFRVTNQCCTPWA